MSVFDLENMPSSVISAHCPSAEGRTHAPSRDVLEGDVNSVQGRGRQFGLSRGRYSNSVNNSNNPVPMAGPQNADPNETTVRTMRFVRQSFDIAS